MPIVTRRKILLHGKDFTKKVGYRPREREFHISFPDYVAALLGYDEATGKSQYAAESKWIEGIEKYEKRTSILERVIFYRFLSRIRPYGTPKGGHDTAYQAKGEMLSSGIAMDLWWLAGYVVKIPDGSEDYLDRNKKKFGNSRSPINYMAWSEIREIFFAEFRKMMEHQISRMHAFFYEDRAKVPELIDEGMKGARFLPHLTEDE